MNVEHINAVGSKLLEAMTHEQRQAFTQSLSDLELHVLVNMSCNHSAAVDELVMRFVRVTSELAMIDKTLGNAKAFDSCKTRVDKVHKLMATVRGQVANSGDYDRVPQ